MNSLPKTVTRQRRDCDCPSAPESSTLTTLLPSHPGWLSKFQSIVIAVVWWLAWMQLQDLRGNIRVFCRCRYDSRTQCCLRFPSDTEVLPPSTGVLPLPPTPRSCLRHRGPAAEYRGPAAATDTEILPPTPRSCRRAPRNRSSSTASSTSTPRRNRCATKSTFHWTGPTTRLLSDTRVGDKVRRVRASLRQVRGLCPVGSGRVWSGPCCGIWQLQGIRGWRTSPLFV